MKYYNLMNYPLNSEFNKKLITIFTENYKSNIEIVLRVPYVYR